MEKVAIQVREEGTGYLDPGPVIETIQRKVWVESIGNFIPVFCRYQNKIHLVHSLKGDLSDPFRADESYLDSLYIIPSRNKQ